MIAIGQAASGALIHFVWQGALGALLFSILLAALRRRPAQSRYLAGCAALLVLAMMPIVTTWFLYRPVPLARTELASQLVSDWTLPLWAIGVLLVSLRPVWNLVQVRELRRNGARPGAWIVDLASSVAKRMGCSRSFGLLTAAIGTPSVAGWMRPVILLPAATIAGLTVEQLETVLAHEIAHIRRHDYLVNLLQVAVETLLFYHPAVWWISSRIRLERELCCDDEVVHATGDALCYARALTVLERLRAAKPAVAMGSTGGPLSYRIRRLVGDAPSSPEIRPAIPALVVILALTLACATISVRWARAQQDPDTVTIEVIRDEQFAISALRVISGPAYLRPLALRAAVVSQPAIRSNINAVPAPLPPDLAPAQSQVKSSETITFPAAFEKGPDQQQAIVKAFVNDQLAQAERAVQAITGNSLEDQRNLHAAREKLALSRRRQSLVLANEIVLEGPKREWKAQVLRHQITEFRRQNQGKLSPGANPELKARYTRMLQELAAAERGLTDVGVR